LKRSSGPSDAYATCDKENPFRLDFREKEGKVHEPARTREVVFGGGVGGVCSAPVSRGKEGDFSEGLRDISLKKGKRRRDDHTEAGTEREPRAELARKKKKKTELPATNNPLKTFAVGGKNDPAKREKEKAEVGPYRGGKKQQDNRLAFGQKRREGGGNR